MRLEALINKNYDLLTANDREIANTIFREKKAVREMNSTQLSSFLNISRTTLVRFMKKLGNRNVCRIPSSAGGRAGEQECHVVWHERYFEPLPHRNR